MKEAITILLFSFFSISSKSQTNLPVAKKKATIDSLKNIPLRVLASDYYATNLPFFCKKELQVQKIVKVPLKFRIGSVEEVDKLEGKHSGRP